MIWSDASYPILASFEFIADHNRIISRNHGRPKYKTHIRNSLLWATVTVKRPTEDGLHCLIDDKPIYLFAVYPHLLLGGLRSSEVRHRVRLSRLGRRRRVDDINIAYPGYTPCHGI